MARMGVGLGGGRGLQEKSTDIEPHILVGSGPDAQKKN